MSVEQIEQQIQQLAPRDVMRLAQWFKSFLASDTFRLTAESDWQETPELIAVLDRRLAEFTANPGVVAPFEPDYFENLRRQLTDERGQKASAR